MVSSSPQPSSRRCEAVGGPRHGIEKQAKRGAPPKKKRTGLPPPREITLRPATRLSGSVQKLHAEVARLEKLPVGSRYRNQRLQVVRHALKLATATETICAQDELELDKLLSALSL